MFKKRKMVFSWQSLKDNCWSTKKPVENPLVQFEMILGLETSIVGRILGSLRIGIVFGLKERIAGFGNDIINGANQA